MVRTGLSQIARCRPSAPTAAPRAVMAKDGGKCCRVGIWPVPGLALLVHAPHDGAFRLVR
jgi:hypothetical protein